MRYAILMLMLISAPCWAVPTGTVTRSVMTDSNGVLIGWASNLVTANGIATTAQLAEVSGDLGAISNLAASALATGVSAQATADSAMATGTAAMAALTASNAAFRGAVIDSLAGATNYPEPIFTNWLFISGAPTSFAMITSHTHSAHGVTTNGGFRGGTDAMTTWGGAIGNSTTSGMGGAVGRLAYCNDGAAVGMLARSTNGAALGYLANALSGGAVGNSARANNGGAVGFGAQSAHGGAIGYTSKSGNGFAGGNSAYATDTGTEQGTGIDAIQLGSGGNTNEGTLQVYTYQLMSANGRIPFARLSFQGCPTSDVNLVSGDVWSSNGILRVVQ